MSAQHEMREHIADEVDLIEHSGIESWFFVMQRQCMW